MRKIFIMALFLVSSLAVRAQMFITPFLPAEMEGLSDNNISLLENRLAQIINQNGMICTDESRFVLTMHWTILDKEIVGSAPTVIVYNLDVNVALGDGITGTKYASTSFTMKGAGNNEPKALLNAMKSLNNYKDKIGAVLQEGSLRMVEYFETNKKTILAEVKAMIAQERYDEAVYAMAQIPKEVSYYSEAQNLLGKAYKGYVNQNAAEQLQQARAIWAASPSQENALNVMALVCDIDPSSSSYAGAQALINEVEHRVRTLDNEDRALATRLIEHEAGLDQVRYETARKVAVKNGKRGSSKTRKSGNGKQQTANNKKSTTYNKTAIKKWWY